MRKNFLVFAILMASGIHLTTPTLSNARDRQPSILWIMLDDGRADALGCYGRSWAKTPNMDSIAAEGVRFQTAIVQSPVCVPSRRCLKTGLYAHQTGVIAMGAPQRIRVSIAIVCCRSPSRRTCSNHGHGAVSSRPTSPRSMSSRRILTRSPVSRRC